MAALRRDRRVLQRVSRAACAWSRRSGNAAGLAPARAKGISIGTLAAAPDGDQGQAGATARPSSPCPGPDLGRGTGHVPSRSVVAGCMPEGLPSGCERLGDVGGADGHRHGYRYVGLASPSLGVDVRTGDYRARLRDQAVLEVAAGGCPFGPAAGPGHGEADPVAGDFLPGNCSQAWACGLACAHRIVTTRPTGRQAARAECGANGGRGPPLRRGGRPRVPH